MWSSGGYDKITWKRNSNEITKVFIYLNSDTENRERDNKMHEQFVLQKREENEKLKKDIKDKVSANFKS